MLANVGVGSIATDAAGLACRLISRFGLKADLRLVATSKRRVEVGCTSVIQALKLGSFESRAMNLPTLNGPPSSRCCLTSRAASPGWTIGAFSTASFGCCVRGEEAKGISREDKERAKALAKKLGAPVEYAPWWVRILSAVCLGLGTMIGYQRIVTTLGQRLGKIHLTPAQGASAETVSSILIGISGFSGCR
jgi:phosphate/sulfate permease